MLDTIRGRWLRLLRRWGQFHLSERGISTRELRVPGYRVVAERIRSPNVRGRWSQYAWARHKGLKPYWPPLRKKR
jgi:hypothetical protein